MKKVLPLCLAALAIVRCQDVLAQRATNTPGAPAQVGGGTTSGRREAKLPRKAAPNEDARGGGPQKNLLVRGPAHMKAAEAAFGLGMMYGRAGRHKDAAEAFTEAILYNPSHAGAHSALGRALYESGQWTEAAEALKRAAALGRKDAEGLTYLGAAYFRQGVYGRAVEAYRAAIPLAPSSVAVRYNLANAYYKQGLYEQAVLYYKEAGRLGPASAELFNDLGVAYARWGRYREAAEAFRRATALDAGDAYAHNNLALYYRLAGQHREAAQAFGHATRLAPRDATIRRNADPTPPGPARGRSAVGERVSLRPNGGVGAGRWDATWMGRSDVVRSVEKFGTPAPAGGRKDLTARTAPTNGSASAPAAGVGAPKTASPPSPSSTPSGTANVPARSTVSGGSAPTAPGGGPPSSSPPPSGTAVVPPRTRVSGGSASGEVGSAAPSPSPSPLGVVSVPPRPKVSGGGAAGEALGAAPAKGGPSVAAPPVPSRSETASVTPMTKESGGGAPGDAGGAAAAKGEPSAPAPAVPSGSKVAGSEAPAKGEPPAAPPAPPVKAPALTDVYRVGVGDVLDIRLLEDKMGSSTLYMVLAGGLVEYPPLGTPFAAAGKTTDEIAAHIGSELRRLKLSEDPRPVVSVRDYASHTLHVSGLVREPGAKILRREAVPLYVVIADAQPLPEAGRVLIMSEAGARATEAALDDPAAMGTLVRPGDVVSVLGGQRQFYYIGGEVAAPGQKDFHDGITLTQAILAAGGSLTEIKRVLVTRQAEGGVLSVSKYNLKEIMGGGVPDPALRSGDRVETVR